MHSGADSSVQKFSVNSINRYTGGERDFRMYQNLPRTAGSRGDAQTATTCVPFSYVNGVLDRDRETSVGMLEHDIIKENPTHPPRSAAPGVPRRQYHFLHGQKWVHDANAESLESPYGNDERVE